MNGALLLDILLFIVAITILLKGSDFFIDSAEKIGRSFGISPFVIGITIVAFGTSLPELASSIAAVLQGQSEIVIANVIGSNIANIALVLGLVAVTVKQINLDNDIWHIDMGFLWASAFLLGFIIYDGEVSKFEAAIFLICIVVFLIYSLGNSNEEDEEKISVSVKDYLLLIAGGFAVYIGATYTIEAITKISTAAGIPTETIALSVVALGTSLPEVVVSIGAARKGKTSIAVGNVLGSNIFNTFIVTSIPAFIGPLEIPPDVIAFSLPFMIAMTLLFGVMSKNQKITLWEGIMLLILYLFYTVKLFGG